MGHRHRRPRRQSQHHRHHLDDLKSATAQATGQTVYGDDLSAATIRRLACDANVIPLVLGSNSEPLDVGRRERLVTRHIRHALNARDRGCVVCLAPPVMCDAHHLTSWLDGGTTTVENLALLCRRHHVDLHNGRWHITITNGQVHVARPTWATPHSWHPAHPPNEGPTQPAAATPVPPVGPYPPEPHKPPDNPWGDPPTPIPRTTRWKADEATLIAAARFAVWGTRTPTGPATGPPPFVTI